MTVEVISTGADDLNWVGPLPPLSEGASLYPLKPSEVVDYCGPIINAASALSSSTHGMVVRLIAFIEKTRKED